MSAQHADVRQSSARSLGCGKRRRENEPGPITLDKKLYADARNAVPDNVTPAPLPRSPRNSTNSWPTPKQRCAHPAAKMLLQPSLPPPTCWRRPTAPRAILIPPWPTVQIRAFSRTKTLATLRRVMIARPTRVAPEIDWWKTKALAAVALAWDHDRASSRLVLSLADNRARHRPRSAQRP